MKEEKQGLTLRATAEQRQWMTAMAKSKGLTVQAYFEEIMREQQDSPWVKADEIKMSVPSDLRVGVEALIEIKHYGGKTGKDTTLNLLTGLCTFYKDQHHGHGGGIHKTVQKRKQAGGTSGGARG